MALANYADLQASIASWTHRSNLTAQIPDFIALAESEINTDMRLRLMAQTFPLTLLSGTQTVAMPARFIEPIQLEIVFTGRDNKPLTYLSAQQITNNSSAGVAGEPQYWTIDEDNISFPYPADQDYALSFRMLQGFSLANTSTNALMTKYPGIYLYGSLLQAAAFGYNDARIPVWKTMYEGLKKKINKSESRTEVLTNMKTDVPITSWPAQSILRGS